MTRPCAGRLRGTTSAKRTSPPAFSSRILSRSLAPPIVWLATTRTVFTRYSLPRHLGRAAARRRGRAHLAGLAEHAVDGPRHPVLVGAAHHRGHRVEVEDRRRRGDLPLQREGPPRVGLRPGAAPPA